MKRKNTNQNNQGMKKFKGAGGSNPNRRQFNTKNNFSLIQNPIPNPGYLDFNEPQPSQSNATRPNKTKPPVNNRPKGIQKRPAQVMNNKIRKPMVTRLAALHGPPRFPRNVFPPPPGFRPVVPPVMMRRPMPPPPPPMFTPPIPPFGPRFPGKKPRNVMKPVKPDKKVITNRKPKNTKYQGPQYPMDKPWITEDIKTLHAKKLELENKLKGKKDDTLFEEYKTVTHTFIQLYNLTKEKQGKESGAQKDNDEKTANTEIAGKA